MPSTLLPADPKFSSRRLCRLVVGCALVTATIAGANIFVLVQSYRNTLHEVQDDLLRQSLTLSELVDRTFQSADLVLADVANKIRADAATDADLHQLSTEQFHSYLTDEKSQLPQIDTLGVLDSHGVRLNHSRSWPADNIDLSSREYFYALKANPKIRSYIGEPVLGVVTGSWVVMIARPVLANDGHFLGAVFAATALNYFQDLFRSTSLGNGYAATLLRLDGTLLARFPMVGTVGTVIPATVLKTIANSRAGISRSVSPIDHEPRIAAAYRLSTYPLTVVVTQTESAAFSPWRTTAVTMAIVTFLIITLVVASTFLVARSWKQQDRLAAANRKVIEADKERALAEVELVRQKELGEQSMRLKAAIENMSQGICMFDAQSKLVISNQPYGLIYKLPHELRRPGTAFEDIIAFCVKNRVFLGGNDSAIAVKEKLSSLSTLSAETRSDRIVEHADGKLIHVVREPMVDGGWVTTHEDITAQQRAQLELERTKRFLDSIIENIPAAVVVKDAATRKYVLVNRAFERMLDLPRTDLLDRTVFDIFDPEDADLVYKADSEALEQPGNVTFKELEVGTATRGTRIQATSRIIICNGDGKTQYLIVVIEDVTERRKTEQQIAFLAHHDGLTGLANRSALAQKIEDAAARQRRRGEPFSVLLLDLDRFKQVNDTLGHPAGDALLIEVAGRLRALLRETDVLSRLGGDEFAIVLGGETRQRDAASTLAKRIIEALGQPFNINGTELSIGTSIGIVLSPEHDNRADNLLKMADLALYQAKSDGRNRSCFFDVAMSESASARHEIEVELRRAVQQGELILHYQPIIDTKSGKICSVEALLRWQHPTKGMIFPDQFITLAEETGLITQIGEWVLRTACAEAAKWPASMKVSVNLSLVQFRKADLADVVMRSIAESGLPAERLELEITETALIESAAECLPALRQFKRHGITIVLDDFGTGYSSLSQLAMFPFDKIKIDKSFTQNMTKRSECAAIISATLTLAQSLNIATTAEGVETPEQYRLLQLAGVTALQGYLFRRPGPAHEIDFECSYDVGRMEDAA